MREKMVSIWSPRSAGAGKHGALGDCGGGVAPPWGKREGFLEEVLSPVMARSKRAGGRLQGSTPGRRKSLNKDNQLTSMREKTVGEKSGRNNYLGNMNSE